MKIARRPDLGLWALGLTALLVVAGWRRRVVFSHIDRVGRHFGWAHGEGPGLWAHPIWLYLGLVSSAARDLLGFLAASYPRPFGLTPGSGTVLEAMRTGPCLFLTAHVHHFEAFGSRLGALGLPLRAIARPMSRPFAQRWLAQARARIGLPVVWSQRPGRPDASALYLREAVRHVRAGGCLAMLWDQRPPRPMHVTSRPKDGHPQRSGRPLAAETGGSLPGTFLGGTVACDDAPRFVWRHAGGAPIYAGFLQPDGKVRLSRLHAGGFSRGQPTEEEEKKVWARIERRYHRWLAAVTRRYPVQSYWMLHRRFDGL